MTKKEEARLATLLKKKEQEKKKEKEFWREVRIRKDEILLEFGLAASTGYKHNQEPTALEAEIYAISEMYGCSVGDLLAHISTERQIDYYKRHVYQE